MIDSDILYRLFKGVPLLCCGIILLSTGPLVAQSNSIGLLDSIKTALVLRSALESARLDVDYAEGRSREESGRFDTAFQFGADHGETRTPLYEGQFSDIESILDTQSTYYFGLSKSFRTGLNLGLEFQTTRTMTEYNPDTSDAAPPVNSSSGVYLTATLPLLKGLGTAAAAGMEQAAWQETEASKIRMKHEISDVVRETGIAYWNYAVDFLYLEQLRSAEKSAEDLFQQTVALVETDELPASEIDEAMAYLSAKKTARIGGEQSFNESRRALGMAMGISFEMIRTLPPPQDSFALVETEREVLSALDEDLLIDYALSQRFDLRTAERMRLSAATREKALENQLLPDMALGMRAGYEGLMEGDSYAAMPESAAANVPGMNWEISLAFRYPIENRQARGRLEQQQAISRRQDLERLELIRNIQSSVHLALSGLSNSIEELDNARKTVGLYEKALENQVMKSRMAMSTRMDLINTQDRLIQARQSMIEAHYKCAVSLISLRFQTATLVSFTNDQVYIDLENLTHFPAVPFPGGD
jgi:outer membrane protein TolC